MLLLMLEGKGAEDDADQSQKKEQCTQDFLALANAAAKDRAAAIIFAEVGFTEQERTSRVFTHYLAVNEVIKPFRDDNGLYYIPTAGAEMTGWDKTPALKVGQKYVMIIRLRFNPYGCQLIDGWLHFTGGCDYEDACLQELKNYVKERAEYGSSPYLEAIMNEELDALGRRTIRANGYMDPEAFGLGKKRVIEEVGKGGRLLLLRIAEVKKTEVQNIRFDIIDDISGKTEKNETDIWVQYSREYIEQSGEVVLPHPYHIARLTRGNVHLYLLRPLKDGVMMPVADMSPIGPDDAVIREMRGWFEK